MKLLACDDDKVGTAVEHPRTLIVAEREGTFLTVGNDLDPLRRNAEKDKVVADGARPPFSESEIVLAGVAFVAVALDQNRDRGLSLQPG